MDNSNKVLKSGALKKYTNMLTVRDMCEVLQVGRKTIYGMMNRGELKYVKIGKKHVTTQTWVLECLKEMSEKN